MSPSAWAGEYPLEAARSTITAVLLLNRVPCHYPVSSEGQGAAEAGFKYVLETCKCVKEGGRKGGTEEMEGRSVSFFGVRGVL